MGILETIGDKLGLRGDGDKMQYLLVGALALVIVIAIVVIITNVMGGKKKPGIEEKHFWDLKAEKEIVLKIEDFRGSETEPGRDIMMGAGLMMNPKDGERTLLPMDICPSCEKWYLPDAYKNLRMDDFDETGRLIGGAGQMLMMESMQKNCPLCGIDIIQYQRDQSKK